ncbi:MAG: hypothetical protein ACK4YP_25975, partial [Myxococcota bacterium]
MPERRGGGSLPASARALPHGDAHSWHPPPAARSPAVPTRLSLSVLLFSTVWMLACAGLGGEKD